MRKTLRLILLLTLLGALLTPVLASTPHRITLDFYYSTTCQHCREKIPVIQAIEHNYSKTVLVRWKQINNTLYYNEYRNYSFTATPGVVIQNTTKILYQDMTYPILSHIIDNLTANLGPGYFTNPNIITVPVFGDINLTSLSLPVLTITLGALDSINPCSFFVLFFLLSLLVSLQSRRKMLLIGSVFIVFSGLIYFLFMFVLLNTLVVLQNILLISLAAGAVAIIMGVLNVKDFFFFKQGPSLSIPENRRHSIFGRARGLVHTTYLPAIMGGAVFLAVTVNFYELLCTLGFPLVYTTQLAAYHLPALSYNLYLVLYNIVYVLPLIIILLFFTFTLGKAKLSEWRGRQLKLLSGVMILSFGILFIVDFTVLQNVWVPIGLLAVSVLVTLAVSFLMRRRMPPVAPAEPGVIGAEGAGPAGTSESESNPPPGS